MAESTAASFGSSVQETARSRRDRASRPAGSRLVSRSRGQGFKNKGGEGTSLVHVAFCREASWSLLLRALTAPQISWGRGVTLASPGSLGKFGKACGERGPCSAPGIQRLTRGRGLGSTASTAGGWLGWDADSKQGGDHPDLGAAGHDGETGWRAKRKGVADGDT